MKALKKLGRFLLYMLALAAVPALFVVWYFTAPVVAVVVAAGVAAHWRTS